MCVRYTCHRCKVDVEKHEWVYIADCQTADREHQKVKSLLVEERTFGRFGLGGNATINLFSKLALSWASARVCFKDSFA